MKKQVVIILGSDSDLSVMSASAKILEDFKIDYEITISSAHRSPERTIILVEKYYKNGARIIIAGAGLAAHLAGVIAAHFPLPVIGVPLESGAFNGIDALYSTVQMPPGVPVAAVGIDNAKNAGLLAIQILAVGDKKLERKLVEYKKSLAEDIGKKSEKLKRLGWQEYLAQKQSK